MEMLLFLLGLILGGLSSWGLAHVYYRRASQDQKTLFNKLSEEVRDAILHDNREKLSVSELNELIREKTVDEDVGGVLPYAACPKCGSEDLERTSDVEVDYGPEGPELGGYYDIVRCKECDWKKTSHGYESARDEM